MGLWRARLQSRVPRRSFASAGLAAAVYGAEVVLLVLFLNPEVSALAEWSALLRVFAAYVLPGTLLLALVALLASALRWWSPQLRPALPALPWFTSLALLALLAASALYWLNLLAYRHALPEESVRALLASSLVLSGAALTLVAVACDVLLFPSRGRCLAAAVVVLAVVAAVVVPLRLRPRPAPPRQPVPLDTEPVRPARRVVLVGLDGLSPEWVHDGVARGNLPALARLLRRGASGPLASLRPTEGPTIWTTIFTGRYPRAHGVKSFATYRLQGSTSTWELLPKGALVGLLERVGLVTRLPVTAHSRKRRALWEVLNAFGIETGVVRFWGTSPPEHLKGFMLGHSFHLVAHEARRAAALLHPPDLAAEVAAQAVSPRGVDPALVAQFVDFSVELPDDRVPWRRDLIERALAPDLTYERAGRVLRAAYDPPFFATYFFGLDPVGHTFLRYAQPDRFGNVGATQVRRYGRVLDRYLAHVSQSVGEIAQGLRPDEVLLVVSGYGLHPVSPWRRLVASLSGDEARSGSHDDAPDGFILAVGDGIRPGARFEGASVLDVMPTILYLMGLPVARDMEGRVAAEIVDDAFARAHPLTFIPSFESLAVRPLTAAPDPDLPIAGEDLE